METFALKQLSHDEMIVINGGGVDEAYDTGYAIGQAVGKFVKNFLTVTGIARILSLI